MAVLERQVKQVRRGKWQQIDEMYAKWQEAESRYGYPPQKRYRALSGSDDRSTLIIEREWESFAAMEAAFAKAGEDPDIQALSAESGKVYKSMRFEFYSVIE